MDWRIVHSKIDKIGERVVEKSWPIGPWQARTADLPAVDSYKYDGPWRKVDFPERFRGGKTVFLRTNIKMPAKQSLKDLRIECSFREMEGLLSVDGTPRAGIDANHKWTTLPSGSGHELLFEFISVPASYIDPALLAEYGQFDGARLVQVNRTVESAHYDLHFLRRAEDTETNERRKRLLHGVLEDALLSIDLTASRDRFVADLSAMRNRLADGLAAIGTEGEGGRLCLTGHSHIDTAWLWPIRETIRKCGRTFSTAVRLMEQYPDYVFSCSQAQLYAYTKKHYPDLYKEIRKWIKRGRWQTTGAMWVEADCNVTSGESLVRQLLYGIEFFRAEFGTRPRCLWLPDVFGYNAALPQILHRSGLPHFFTAKLYWECRNMFPYNLFWWHGIDGTRVLSHIPRAQRMYNNNTEPDALRIAWDYFQQKTEYGESLLSFGHGDGGGGPTPAMIEYAGRAQDYPGLPKCRIAGGEEYLEQAAREARDLPAWHGELYLETHRGTDTTHGVAKAANRRNEFRYRDAEIFSSIARTFGLETPVADLKEGWQTILLHQFHDILPGSSIAQVYTEMLADHDRIGRVGDRIIDRSAKTVVGNVKHVAKGRNICVFNSQGWDRSDMATVSVRDPGKTVSFVDAAGNETPGQVIGRKDGKADVVFTPAAVPAMGYAVFSVQAGKQRKSNDSVLNVTATSMENRYYCLELDDAGAVTRLYDKRCDREVGVPGALLNDLQLSQDGPEPESAWNVHDACDKRRYPFEGKTTVRVLERGPVRAIVRVKRRHRKSVIEQDITLYDRIPRIDFVTRVDWRERQTLLKAAFPVDIVALTATFEIQFGALERPVHRNTSWDQEKFEVCGLRWADMSESGYGVSLLNDSKYGHDVKPNLLRITLLRGTEWPDPTADLGHHEFTYSLLPHAGDWRDAETVLRALELNVPMRAVLCSGKSSGQLPASHSFITVAGRGVVLETLKRAEDGRGMILRLYESCGGRGPVSVHSRLPVKSVVECNLVEEDEGRVRSRNGRFTFEIKPYEIKTFRLV